MIYKGKDIDLRSGDIILFRTAFKLYNPSTWLSAAIRFFTKCRYNHAALIVSNWGKLFLNEAISYGVVGRPAETHVDTRDRKILVLRKKTPIVEETICRKANSKLGIGYDYKSLIFDQPIYRIFKKWVGVEEEKASKLMVCSEYVSWVHDLGEWWKYSPKEILESTEFEVIYQE